MLAALQSCTHQGKRGVGIHCGPLATVDLVSGFGLDVLSGSIQQVDVHLWLLVGENLLLQIHRQYSLAVTQGQRQLSASCLPGRVCDIGGDDEGVELGVEALRHGQGHVDAELALVVGLGLALGDVVAIVSIAYGGGVPVAAIRPPPEGSAPHHLVAHRSLLYGYAGIAQGLACNGDGIVGCIGLLHLGELHVERRPLVFLHTEVMARVVHTDMERAGQTRRG